MAEHLGEIDPERRPKDLPSGFRAHAWSDEIVFSTVDSDTMICQYPFVPGFFVTESIGDARTTLPIAGPFKSIKAAYAAWKLMQ